MTVTANRPGRLPDGSIPLARCRPAAAVGLTILAVLAASCTGPADRPDAADAAGEDAAADGPAAVTVAVPVQPLAGLVEAIAPADVDVVVLIPPGANPATHEPSLDELRRAQSAAIYFELGHPSFVFERSWLEGLLGGTGVRRVPVFADCETVEDDYHAWLSAGCLESAARLVAGALSQAGGSESAAVRDGLQAFLAELAAADSAAGVRLDGHSGRAILVLHPAWGYLLRPHGIAQRSILSHGTGDPGPARLAALIDEARAEGIRHVFVQPQFNQSPARLVADELGADLVSLDPLSRDPVRAIATAARAFEAALDEEETP